MSHDPTVNAAAQVTNTFTWSGSITGSMNEDHGTGTGVAGWQANVETSVQPQVTRVEVGNDDWAMSAVMLRAA